MTTKLYPFIVILLFSTFHVFSQKNQINTNTSTEPKIIKLIKTTAVKNQENTNACWSFATTSFIETEAIRLGKKPVTLSPIFYVIPTYIDKAEKYIRMHGISFFGAGDLTFSVMKAYENFGAVPEFLYEGKTNKGVTCNYSLIDDSLLAKVKYLR